VTAADNLAARSALAGTTILITSVGTPTISRADGLPIGSGDLQVSGVALQANKTDWLYQGTLGQEQPSGTIYRVDFPLTLSNGDTITRSALHKVKPR